MAVLPKCTIFLRLKFKLSHISDLVNARTQRGITGQTAVREKTRPRGSITDDWNQRNRNSPDRWSICVLHLMRPESGSSCTPYAVISVRSGRSANHRLSATGARGGRVVGTVVIRASFARGATVAAWRTSERRRRIYFGRRPRRGPEMF